MSINFLGTNLKVETKVIRRKWETVIRSGITAKCLRDFLDQVPGNATIESIDEHEYDSKRTVITFVQETSAEPHEEGE